jgi:hypothetical protein
MSDSIINNSAFAERLINKILTARGAEQADDTHVHASYVNRCVRQTYYNITRTPPDVDKNPNDNRINLIYKYGDAIEYVLTTQMQLAGIWRGRRTVSFPEHDLVGTTDPVVEFEGHLVVLEIKGTHREHFRWVMKSHQANECEPQYYDQVQTYLHLSPEIEFGVLIVTNRDMRPRDEFPPYLLLEIHRDDEWKRINWKRLEILTQAKKTGVPPNREFEQKDWHCQYCAWRDTCWGNTLILDDLPSTSTPNASKSTGSTN